MSAALFAWLRAFLFTQLVEVPIYQRSFGARRVTTGGAFLATTLTHPIVWFVFPRIGDALGLRHVPMVALAELFAGLAEALWFARLPQRFFEDAPVYERIPLSRALFASFVANSASLGLGLLARHFFGVP